MTEARDIIFAAIASLAFGLVKPLRAAVFFVDPQQGDMRAGGSAERPWKTVQGVFEGGLIQTRGPDGRIKNEGARAVSLCRAFGR